MRGTCELVTVLPLCTQTRVTLRNVPWLHFEARSLGYASMCGCAWRGPCTDRGSVPAPHGLSRALCLAAHPGLLGVKLLNFVDLSAVDGISGV